MRFFCSSCVLKSPHTFFQCLQGQKVAVDESKLNIRELPVLYLASLNNVNSILKNNTYFWIIFITIEATIITEGQLHFTRSTTDPRDATSCPQNGEQRRIWPPVCRASGKSKCKTMTWLLALDDKLDSQLSLVVVSIFGSVILSRQPEEQGTRLSQFATGWLEKCHLKGHVQYHF